MNSDDLFDELLESLEEMIDAKDEMWEEEQNCNYRWRDKIKEEKYGPARTAFKKYFDDYLDDRIRRYMERHSYKIGRTIYK
jgi:hypothetical protein